MATQLIAVMGSLRSLLLSLFADLVHHGSQAAAGAIILLLNSALLFAMLLMLLGNYRQAVTDRWRVWWSGVQRALRLVAADARAQRRQVLQQLQLGRGSANVSGGAAAGRGDVRRLDKQGQSAGQQCSTQQWLKVKSWTASSRLGVEEGYFNRDSSLLVRDRQSTEAAPEAGGFGGAEG